MEYLVFITAGGGGTVREVKAENEKEVKCLLSKYLKLVAKITGFQAEIKIVKKGSADGYWKVLKSSNGEITFGIAAV